jgi:hypothetical protein
VAWEEVWFLSPEDVVRRKLAWERLSGGVLTHQRRDVLGVLKAMRGRLDLEYLRKVASSVGLRSALDDCLESAGA